MAETLKERSAQLRKLGAFFHVYLGYTPIWQSPDDQTLVWPYPSSPWLQPGAVDDFIAKFGGAINLTDRDAEVSIYLTEERSDRDRLRIVFPARGHLAYPKRAKKKRFRSHEKDERPSRVGGASVMHYPVGKSVLPQFQEYKFPDCAKFFIEEDSESYLRVPNKYKAPNTIYSYKQESFMGGRAGAMCTSTRLTCYHYDS